MADLADPRALVAAAFRLGAQAERDAAIALFEKRADLARKAAIGCSDDAWNQDYARRARDASSVVETLRYAPIVRVPAELLPADPTIARMAASADPLRPVVRCDDGTEEPARTDE